VSEALHRYYLGELNFIREMSQEFARQYPETAKRLLLHEGRPPDDPHVERLIEAFAFLAGRVHHKLDDEFPELTDALFSVLYPHYLTPVPSMAVVQFEADARGADLAGGFLVPRHTPLRTDEVDGLRCRYRTAYPVTLWPLSLVEARLQPPPFGPGLDPPQGTQAVLRLRLECSAAEGFAGLSLERLRLYLGGDGAVAADLYELICNDVVEMRFRQPTGSGPRSDPVVVQRDQVGEFITPVGFDRQEGLLPYPPHALPGYRLLTEFFAFPPKFRFVDIGGWREVAGRGFGRDLELVLCLRRTLAGREQTVSGVNFRLGCSPVVNLFAAVVEPRAIDHTLAEYPLLPDADHPRGMEVYSVESVRAVAAAGGTREYRPFYSLRHGAAASYGRTYWYASRRPSPGRDDAGTDVLLTLVDLDFRPTDAPDATLVVETLCTNRNLPARLQQAEEGVRLELELAGPRVTARCVHRPTLPLRRPPARGTYWRLVSHLSLNQLSLVDGADALHALKEILRLYDYSDQEGDRERGAVVDQLLDGLLGVTAARKVSRIGGAAGGLCRGVEVTMELDEQKYVGTGGFLFASVLERFLALHVSLNSFTQLVARSRQRREPIKRWPPRAGDQPLL
jgi:type VI secretion system protein ImpG